MVTVGAFISTPFRRCLDGDQDAGVRGGRGAPCVSPLRSRLEIGRWRAEDWDSGRSNTVSSLMCLPPLPKTLRRKEDAEVRFHDLEYKCAILPQENDGRRIRDRGRYERILRGNGPTIGFYLEGVVRIDRLRGFVVHDIFRAANHREEVQGARISVRFIDHDELGSEYLWFHLREEGRDGFVIRRLRQVWIRTGLSGFPSSGMRERTAFACFLEDHAPCVRISFLDGKLRRPWHECGNREHFEDRRHAWIRNTIDCVETRIVHSIFSPPSDRLTSFDSGLCSHGGARSRPSSWRTDVPPWSRTRGLRCAVLSVRYRRVRPSE